MAQKTKSTSNKKKTTMTDIGIEKSKSDQMKKEIAKIFAVHGLRITPARLMSIMWSSDTTKA